MTDAALALIRAAMPTIREHHDADEPRLLLADRLEDVGECGYAEFIRDGARMGRHTDCPTRRIDVGRGRPVPLRCGVCDYCLARRRSEAFYYRHPWFVGHNYAVCLDPTPLDGPIPDGPGITAAVTRGFLHTLRGPSAAVLPALDAVCELHPVRRVGLTDVPECGITSSFDVISGRGVGDLSQTFRDDPAKVRFLGVRTTLDLLRARWPHVPADGWELPGQAPVGVDPARGIDWDAAARAVRLGGSMFGAVGEVVADTILGLPVVQNGRRPPAYTADELRRARMRPRRR